MVAVPIHENRIGTYEVRPAAYQPYDPRYPAVAAHLIALIEERMPVAHVEHIGSTAVPGCAGKGNIDLLMLYPPGHISQARGALDTMGFQRGTGRDAFPESRPVRIGTIEHDDTTFYLHVHVVAADAPEVTEQLAFREALRADATLVRAYEARKREVIAAGITYGPDYSRAKEAFIRGVTAGDQDPG